MQMKISHFFAIGMMLLTTLNSNAGCVNPLNDPQSKDTSKWAELSSFKASNKLNSDIKEVLSIDKGTGDVINLDYYAITIDAIPGKTIHQFFREFRKSLPRDLFAHTKHYSLKPYSSKNVDVWNADNPKGAVMTFVLAGYTPKIPATLRSTRLELENGDVVLSCYSDLSFVFSTIKTEKNGHHPVAGNRGFGVKDNGDGSWTIYTKAADRLNDYFGNTIATLMEGKGSVFKMGHEVWIELLNNLHQKFAKYNPRNKVINSKRYEYPL